MHPDHPVTNRTRRALRSVCGLAVAVAAIGIGTGGDGTVDASPRSTSAVVAAEAHAAVASLERWEADRQPIDYVRFVHHRDRAATLAETEVGLAAGSLRTEWEDAPLTKQEAFLNAVSQLGVPYRSLSSKPGIGFDCSGLTIWAFGRAGLDLPRISRDQIRAVDEVDAVDAEPGDLVYYPGHISIYLGADMMVHSPNSGNHVEITDLPSRSLSFGDADAAPRVEPAVEDPDDAGGSLVDRALAVTE